MNHRLLQQILVASLFTMCMATPVMAQQPVSKSIATPAKTPVKAQVKANQTVLKALVPISSAPLTMEKYLQTMRAPTHEYLQTMLDLVPLGSSVSEDDKASALTADRVERLIGDLVKIEPPADLADLHNQMKESLTPVVTFIKAGGLAKVGFSGALEIAKKMQATSDAYHEAILDIMVAGKLPKSADPFLVQQAAAKAAGNTAKSTAATNIKGGDQTTHLFNDFSNSKSPTNGAAGLSYTSHDPSSLINGVGGSRGMSGLFNGMGGTGTNGLIDGLGFSSGLNGFVNGAGSSSGTSGYLNDLNVMTPVNSGSSGQH